MPWKAIAAITGFAFIGLTTPAAADPSAIGFGNAYFNPYESSRDFAPGDSFVWLRTDSEPDYHTVHEDNGFFDSGDGPTTPGFTVSVSAGSWHYYCEFHGGPEQGPLGGGEPLPGGTDPNGMDGVLRVSAVLVPIDADSFRVVWADAGTATGNAFDARFRVNGRDWRDWKRDVTGSSAIFGKRWLT